MPTHSEYDEALEAYGKWIDGPAGPAYDGNVDVRDGFIDGYLAARAKYSPPGKENEAH